MMNPLSDADVSMFQAVMKGDAPGLALALAQGAQLGARDGLGYTSLGYASLLGHKNCAAMLLEAGANINARCGEGQTPIMKAAMIGNEDCAMMLLRAGADTKARDEDGFTVAELAEKNGYEELGARITGYELSRQEALALGDASAGASQGVETLSQKSAPRV